MKLDPRSLTLRAGSAIIALVSPLAAGCSGELENDDRPSTENIAEARSALEASVIVTTGIDDAQLVRRLGTPLATDPDANANFGALGTFKVGTQGVFPTKRSYKSLVSIDLSFIPPGSTISSALLTLFYVGSTGFVDVRAKRVTAPWDEDTVTFRSWNNAQASDTESSWGISDQMGLAFFEIGSLAQAWHSGVHPNHGVVFLGEGPGTVTFSSTEGQQSGPDLIINFATPDYCAGTVCPAGRTCRNSATHSFCSCTDGFTGEDCEVPPSACPCANTVAGWAQGPIIANFSCASTPYMAQVPVLTDQEHMFSAEIDPVTGGGTCAEWHPGMPLFEPMVITAAEAEICRQQLINFGKQTGGAACASM